ncbi:hypothetical protein [Streptomyces sp. NPDC001268]|uniref:hypothetical protein n=1 Tax=Streptomyces sp. NPDC001268 TaxID=3364553 RepID=UPI0036CF7926
MPGRPSADVAVRLLREQLGGLSSSPATQDAWSAFIRFGRLRFDTSGSPDADGLLFQYGVFSFHGTPAFSLDLTRQFEVLDEAGDHDHLVQVHCELVYEPTPALAALGDFNSWFFHDSGNDVDQWAETLTSRKPGQSSGSTAL